MPFVGFVERKIIVLDIKCKKLFPDLEGTDKKRAQL